MFRVIDQGKVFVNYGPLQMVISTVVGGKASTKLAKKGAEEAIKVFSRVCEDQDLAKKNILLLAGDGNYSKPLMLMIKAARLTGNRLVTPMVAVAGSIAELVKDKIMDLGADKVIVNNGGDIALGIRGRNSISIGVATDLRKNKIDFIKSINEKSLIRGVATSGFGGRSFTLGVASSVVVFAPAASQADACATVLANETSIDDHRVHKVRAGDVDPSTDIPNLMVTRFIEPLPGHLKEKAIGQAKILAQKYIQKRVIDGAVICVQGVVSMIPEGIVESRADQ